LLSQNGQNDKIYALVCNARIGSFQEESSLTEDGFKRIFGTNHLGHFC
jgi:NAD(P)-dependent dehydrogenase (short-subunit alcohol dehydrogenase family)